MKVIHKQQCARLEAFGWVEVSWRLECGDWKVRDVSSSTEMRGNG